MYFSISDNTVGEFLSGLVVVLALVAVGCTIALVLSGMAKRFPFSRLALVLALSPLSFFRFIEYQGNSTLVLYAMIVILLGITIDGINHLLEPKAKVNMQDAAEKKKDPVKQEDPQSGVIVWEKAK